MILRCDVTAGHVIRRCIVDLFSAVADCSFRSIVSHGFVLDLVKHRHATGTCCIRCDRERQTKMYANSVIASGCLSLVVFYWFIVNRSSFVAACAFFATLA